MTLAIIRDVDNWNGNQGGYRFSLNDFSKFLSASCKKCGLKIEIYEDFANFEFIYKTGFCRMCGELYNYIYFQTEKR